MAIATRGSLDWVALSKSTINFSVELLARFSGARVEALTIAVGQALFTQFNVPADAQTRLQRCVSHLRAFSTASDLLWFGVGYKHLVRTLLETERGSSLVAFSSCLMVSYKNEYTAAVLKSLCHRSSMPDNLTPALSQWGALAELCAPAVTASQFPVLVEGFSRLLISRTVIRRPENVLATSPDELATALLELAPLSLGQIASVTMVGRADCAWLAALGVWLFSLRVEIVDYQGNALYQSQDASHHAAADSYQLTIIRLDDSQSSIPQVLTRSRTHLVPPGDLSLFLKTEQSYHFIPGRSEWNTWLTDALDSSFEKLLDPEIIPLFAQVLYSGLYVSDIDPSSLRINPWGRGFFSEGHLQHQQRFSTMLRFAAARLPELAALEKYGRDHISDLAEKEQRREKLPFDVTFRGHFGRAPTSFRDRLVAAKYSDALVDSCLCPQCLFSNSGLSPSKKAEKTDYLCLSKVSVAIFGLLWLISCLDIDDRLRPSSHALRDRCHVLTSVREIREMRLSVMMRDVGFLFSGCETDLRLDVSARSTQGVCVYLPSLEHPSTDAMGQLRLRVVPGHIEWRGKIFGDINENDNPFLRCKARDPSLERPDGDRTTSVLTTLGARPSLQIMMEETLVAASLKAMLVVIPEGKSPVHWNYLYRPHLAGETQAQPQSSCMLWGLTDFVTI